MGCGSSKATEESTSPQISQREFGRSTSSPNLAPKQIKKMAKNPNNVSDGTGKDNEGEEKKTTGDGDGKKDEEETKEEPEDEKSESKTTLQYATDFMKALVPTPQNLADAFSDRTVSFCFCFSLI